jgi:hypothetical protein
MKTEDYNKLFFAAGRKCTINGNGDLMMSREAGAWIGRRCTIIKRCKSGRFLVSWVDDPRQTYVFSQGNIDPDPF